MNIYSSHPLERKKEALNNYIKHKKYPNIEYEFPGFSVERISEIYKNFQNFCKSNKKIYNFLSKNEFKFEIRLKEKKIFKNFLRKNSGIILKEIEKISEEVIEILKIDKLTYKIVSGKLYIYFIRKFLLEILKLSSYEQYKIFEEQSLSILNNSNYSKNKYKTVYDCMKIIFPNKIICIKPSTIREILQKDRLPQLDNYLIDKLFLDVIMRFMDKRIHIFTSEEEHLIFLMKTAMNPMSDVYAEFYKNFKFDFEKILNTNINDEVHFEIYIKNNEDKILESLNEIFKFEDFKNINLIFNCINNQIKFESKLREVICQYILSRKLDEYKIKLLLSNLRITSFKRCHEIVANYYKNTNRIFLKMYPQYENSKIKIPKNLETKEIQKIVSSKDLVFFHSLSTLLIKIKENEIILTYYQFIILIFVLEKEKIFFEYEDINSMNKIIKNYIKFLNRKESENVFIRHFEKVTGFLQENFENKLHKFITKRGLIINLPNPENREEFKIICMKINICPIFELKRLETKKTVVKNNDNVKKEAEIIKLLKREKKFLKSEIIISDEINERVKNLQRKGYLEEKGEFLVYIP